MYQCHNPSEVDPIFGSISLLLANKTVHEEVANILYAENKFWFDDVRDCCGYDYQESAQSDDKLHYCGLAEFNHFLQLIGARNRMRIKWIGLRFSSCQYFFYPEEGAQQAHGMEDQTEKAFGGDFLGKALDLLSKGHALHTLEITINNTEEGTDLIEKFLRANKILERFRKITGIQELRFWPEEYHDYEFIKLLKQEMEAGSQASISTVQSAMPDIRKAVASLATLQTERNMLLKERQEILRRNAALGSRIQEIEGIFQELESQAVKGQGGGR
ncbi:MAG: hypothetical protein Q9187_009110 [Circinaria calcarea]